MIEEWKEIKDYEGIYSVSNLGRVKSLQRVGRKSELILTPTPTTTGYLVVQLRKDKQRKSFLVHRLVMETFNPASEYYEVNHKDFDITNNKISNLEWVTPKENSEHYWRESNLEDRLPTPKGELHHLSVLTKESVLEIRRLWETKEVTNKSELGRMFGVKENTIRQVVNRTTWKDI